MGNRLPPEEYTILIRYVLRRDKWKCRKCLRRDGLHAHHIIFRSQGGLDTTENLIALCHVCHDEVHAHKVVIEALAGFAGINANCKVIFQIVGKGRFAA